MNYWTLLSEKNQKTAEAVVDEIQQWIVDYEEANPGRPSLNADGWVEDPETWVEDVKEENQLEKPILERLKKCKSAIIFESPGCPKENPPLLLVLNRYLTATGQGVMSWGTDEYGWPQVQLSEEAQNMLEKFMGFPEDDDEEEPQEDPDEVVREAKESEASYEQIITLLESASKSRAKSMEVRIFLTKCAPQDQKFLQELVQFGYADEETMAERQGCTKEELRVRAATLADKIFALLND